MLLHLPPVHLLGPRRGVYGVLGFGFLQGVCMLLAGLRPSIPLIAAAAFGGFLCYPIIGGCSQAIWQRKVPPEVQGRVFAVRRAIALSSMPVPDLCIYNVSTSRFSSNFALWSDSYAVRCGS